MRAMKDSGIEWIGQIPQEWNTNRIKYIYEIISGNGFKEHLQGNSTGDYPFYKVSDINGVGRNVYHAANYVSKDVVSEYRFSVVPAGALIMSKIGEALKKNHRKITSVDCVVDNNLQALVPIATIDARYFFYQFLCIDMAWFDNGGTIPSVNNQKLLDFRIASPSISVQKRIADYLDSKCNEIDALISAKEKTNALLKERRQSIIYEAVTKGLNPDAPMKDCGIEWIGQIPKNWKTKKLKYLVNLRTEKTVDKSIPSPYVGLEHVASSVGTLAVDYEPVLDFAGDTIEFKFGDILFGKLRPYLAKAILAKENGRCSSEFWVMEPNSINGRFLLYTVLSHGFISCIDHSTFGVKMPRAEWEYAGNQKLVLPDIDDQQEIVDYLDKACAEIDAVISANEATIQKLKEYRQSIIYEAVTGKIEI